MHATFTPVSFVGASRSWSLQTRRYSSVASGMGAGGQSTPDSKKKKKSGKRENIGKKREKIRKKREKSGKEGKNQEKEEKSGRKGKNLEDSFTLPLLTERAGYATVEILHGYAQLRLNREEENYYILLILWDGMNFLCTILPFYNSVRHQQLTQERPKCALHHGKMLTNKCRAVRNYTWVCFKWPKM